jgi:radical SAM protein with 4Fe4S-binding SPASM domain
MPMPSEDNHALAQSAYDNGDAIVANRPEIFAIELTNHCNIKCIMCPRGEPDIMKREVGHMERATLDAVLAQADYFSGVCWLHWFGEPLMNPYVFEHIAAAKAKIPNAGISTNATLLRPDAQRKILESGLDTLMIAIDGDSKEVYEAVRKSARYKFDDVQRNAESFLALRKTTGRTKPLVMLSIIVMDKTEKDLESYREHWERLGADRVVFKPYANWGGQYSSVFDGLQTQELRARLREQRPHPCKFLWESVVISWDGKVVPCCYDYDAKMVMGDLATQTLDEIWNGDAYVSLRKAEIEGRNSSALCANCSQAPGRERKRMLEGEARPQG